MLTYENITIGQRVEVLHNGEILFGTVLYKGPVIGRRGLWIGIDLSTPDGDSDGTVKGRVYFRAPLNYGIFTTIENVRLATNIRRKPRSIYRTVNKKSVVEEELFGNTDPTTLPPPRPQSGISNAQVTLISHNSFQRSKTSLSDVGEKRFTYSKTLARQYDDKVKKQRQNESLSASSCVDTTEHTFSPAPSIPRIFMPPSEVDRVKRLGFTRMSNPRYTVVHDQYAYGE